MNEYNYRWIEPYKPSRWKTEYWSRVTQPGWTAEQKENGWRLQLIKQPSNQLHVYSSSGRCLPEMEHELVHSVPAQLMPVGTILDTEAVVAYPERCDCLRSGRSVGFDATPHFLANHPEGIQFRCFDLLRKGGELLLEHTLWSRRLYLANVLESMYCGEAPDETHVFRMVNSIMGSDLDLHHWIDELQAGGAEGVVFKNLHSTYKPGRRTVDWLKYKWAMITYDVVLTEVLEPSEKMDLDWRRFAYGWSAGRGAGDGMGPSVGVAPFTCHKSDAPSYIGRVLELKGDELMPSGVILYPRFVRFRDDKRAQDCIEGEQSDD